MTHLPGQVLGRLEEIAGEGRTVMFVSHSHAIHPAAVLARDPTGQGAGLPPMGRQATWFTSTWTRDSANVRATLGRSVAGPR